MKLKPGLPFGPAGQGVTTINNSLSVSDLVSDLKTEFKAAIEEQYKLLKVYK